MWYLPVKRFYINKTAVYTTRLYTLAYFQKLLTVKRIHVEITTAISQIKYVSRIMWSLHKVSFTLATQRTLYTQHHHERLFRAIERSFTPPYSGSAAASEWNGRGFLRSVYLTHLPAKWRHHHIYATLREYYNDTFLMVSCSFIQVFAYLATHTPRAVYFSHFTLPLPSLFF